MAQIDTHDIAPIEVQHMQEDVQDKQCAIRAAMPDVDLDKKRRDEHKLYRSDGKVLYDERMEAKCKVFEFNHLHPLQVKERENAIRSIVGSIGEHFLIEQPFWCDYGYNIHIGEKFYANTGLTILDTSTVTIGDDVLLGPHVGIYAAAHPVSPTLRLQGLEHSQPVTIGNNVWIGGGTSINPGVTIGNNCVIGSGSVVTKDIPPNSVAAGNPCRVIRPITERDEQFYFKDMRADTIDGKYPENMLG